MWVTTIFPPNLSFIIPLTTEMFYRTGITGNTDRHSHTQRQTDTQTESDYVPKQDIGSSKKDKSNNKSNAPPTK